MPKRLTVTKRRFLLSGHILLSVAWFGVMCCFLALTVVAAGTRDETVLRAAYIVVGLLDGILVRPLAIGTAVTGVLLSVLSQWGLFRFYWIIAKQIVTVALIGLGVVLFSPLTGTVKAITTIVSTTGLNALHDPAYQSSQAALLIYFASAVVLLSASVVLSVFRPFGQRIRRAEHETHGVLRPGPGQMSDRRA